MCGRHRYLRGAGARRLSADIGSLKALGILHANEGGAE